MFGGWGERRKSEGGQLGKFLSLAQDKAPLRTGFSGFLYAAVKGVMGPSELLAGPHDGFGRGACSVSLVSLL